MNAHKLNTVYSKTTIRIILLMILSGVIYSCKEEPQYWRVDSAEQVIADFVESNPDEFSEFDKLIKASGMSSLLKIRGPYTLFLPSNESMFNYYEMKDVGSLDDFSKDFLEDLILTHLVPAEIGANDIGLGALRATNAIGDYLSSEFQGSEIIISKYSRIVKRDIRAANGYIHEIDKVLTPDELDTN